MFRWTLRGLALCAIVLTALNLAYVHRHDLETVVQFALNQAPPNLEPQVTAQRHPADGRA